MAIPRIFHFIFGLRAQTEPFHLAHYLCLASCLETQRPEAVMLHYLHEPWGPWWDAIKTRLTLRPLTAAMLETISLPDYPAFKQYRYAHLSDVIRLSILEEEGGVYADIDTLFVAAYPERLFGHACVMGEELLDRKAAGDAAEGSLCNAVILAERGSDFLQHWITRMAAAFDGTWSRHSTFLPFALSRQFPGTIHVEPERSFFYMPWTARGIARIFTREETLPESVYSLHLWSHLWWERSRTDFSSFHAGRITPEYVRHARTTYARYARPYLPEQAGCNTGASWRLQRLQRLGDMGFAAAKQSCGRVFGVLRAVGRWTVARRAAPPGAGTETMPGS